MATYVLLHRHAAAECRFAHAAWRGFASPLRHGQALCSCLADDHRVVWSGVDAASPAAALALIPPFLASRTEAIAVRPINIP